MNQGRAAVFGDIHSNYPAFRACVEDAVRWGAEEFFFLGDFVSDMAEPQCTMEQVYELLAGYPCHLVRGNRDGYMLDCADGKCTFRPGSKTGSLLYTYENLRRKDLEFLRSLPIYRQTTLWGIPLELAHAAPDSDRRIYRPENGEMERLAGLMETRYLLTGHSHHQFQWHGLGRTIINPVSVGVPLGGGCLSQYARLERCGDGLACDLMRIPYDVEGVIRRQFDSGLVELGQCWSASVLSNLITGENHTFALLERVMQLAGGDENAVYDEVLWHRACREMDIPMEKEEILLRYRRKTERNE